MNSYFKKFLSISLVLLLLMSALLGCSGSNDNLNGKTGKNETNDTQVGEEQGNGKGTSDAQEEHYDFGGRTIRYSAWWDLEPEPGSSKSADDFLNRVAELEEKYNFKLEYINLPADQYLEQYVASNLAGEPFADVTIMASYWFYPGLVMNGFLYPLSDLKAFDFSEEKWEVTTKELTTYQGKIYGCEAGKFFPRAGLFWNKTMFEREGLPNLYELQRNKEWTWDKMIEIGKKVTKDTDGDGVIDQWGFGGIYTEWSFILSNNAAVIKDVDGKPVFALDEPNAIEALQMIQDIGLVHKIKPTEGDPTQLFIDGKLAMYNYQWWITDQLQPNMQDDYGFVFFPMGPKANDYVSEVYETNFVSFPSAVKDPEQVAIFWNEMTEPYPDEQPDDWKENHYNRARDTEAVDETITMMLEGRSKFNPLRGFSDAEKIVTENIIWPVAGGSKTPKAAVEESKQQVQMLIDDAISAE